MRWDVGEINEQDIFVHKHLSFGLRVTLPMSFASYLVSLYVMKNFFIMYVLRGGAIVSADSIVRSTFT